MNLYSFKIIAWLELKNKEELVILKINPFV